MDLIYCGGGNRRFYEIATAAGYLYGSRLPETIYGSIYFADQDFKAPNRAAYMAALAEHKPHMATVLDWEQDGQLSEVISWAEEAAQYVQVVMIVPKVHSGIARLPRKINGAEVRLGFSVPTKYGGTNLFLSEFIGWPVHLLGGSPGAQMRLAQYLDVRSADGNMHQNMATSRCLFWQPGRSRYSNAWVSLTQADGERWNGDGPYEAFRRSCVNIMAAWQPAAGR